MRILTSWLREFVDFTAPVETLATDLTMTGLEVEGVEDMYEGLRPAVAGRICQATPHPEAEHLKVCQVDAGGGTVQVVCGAPNVAEGQWVALALPGTSLPDGTFIQAGEFHGAHSEGMLCSERELGIGKDQAGVMVLDPSPELRPGAPLVEVLGLQDWVLEISVTPNRPDCLSVLGVAREVAAIYGLPLKETRGPISPAQTQSFVPTTTQPVVTIEAPELCGRYAVAPMEGIVVGPSPTWLQRRLTASSVRPINNVVDVTNYVLMERGQPLHAFDLDRLSGRSIVVRTARPGESLATLDGKVRTLQPEMLVIADAQRPVAVAGVMGGADSEVHSGTKCILLESAWFAPAQVRRTARALNLSTESSYRFERGTDPEGVLPALERAVELLGQVTEARLAGAPQDHAPRPHQPQRLSLRVERANRLLGTELSSDVMAGILERIGFRLEPLESQAPAKDHTICGLVPSYRPDLTEEIDIVEEVARLYGFATIPTRMPVAELTARPPDALQRLTDTVKSTLRAQGMDEIISYSFCSPKEIEALGLGPEDPRCRTVRLQNPLSEDESVLRTTLVTSLLGAVARNQAQRNLNLRLFEVGTIFLSRGEEEQPIEKQQVTGIWSGSRHPESWSWPKGEADLFDLKGVVETLLEAIGLANQATGLGTPDDPHYISATSLRLTTVNGDMLGTIGEIAPRVLEAWDIEGKVFAFDLSLEALKANSSEERTFRSLPRYPAVVRDVAIVVKGHVPAAELLDFVRGNAPPLLKDVTIFDVYHGKPLRKGFKSIGLHLRYRAEDHTLADEEVNAVHDVLVESLLEAFRGELRA